jgi:putative tryptophan/tyrosine transport system substrate-binding protein
LLNQIAPRIARVAMLFNPVSAPYADYWLNPFKAAATSFAVEAIPAPVRDTLGLKIPPTLIAITDELIE